MNRLVLLTLCIGVFLTSILHVALSPSSSQVTDKNRPEIDFTHFPIVDLDPPKPTNESKQLQRAKKSKKYNNKAHGEISELSNVYFVVNEELSSLPALPVRQSSVVLLGTITSATAYLSEDKGSVYSEFEVQIETVFKNQSKQAVNPSDLIAVERFGGRVRLLSGKLFIAAVDNQDMPRVGARYVLFLTNTFLDAKHSDEDFNILMGYELKGGKVVPLDRASPHHPISRYFEAEESILIRDLFATVADRGSLP